MTTYIKQASGKVLAGLLVAYLIFMGVLAVAPVDRTVWFAENLTVWIIIGLIGFFYWRGVRFSLTAYLLATVLIFMHTYGGHYTFANVPFEWMSDLLGSERNHYDRIAHFSVGLYAFAFAEWLIMSKAVRSKFVLITYPVLAIMSIAAFYELVEMWFALANGGDAATADAYLGSQGDIWDAQNDIIADTLGAVVAMGFFWIYYGKVRITEFLK